jgi:hypothetical protein
LEVAGHEGAAREEEVGMAVLSLVIGSIALFTAGFAVWYTIWHRRVEAAFERLAVESGRSVHVLREGVTLDRDSR